MGTEARAESGRDGRIVRRERNREAIIDALIELIGEGELEPTAEQVAELAGVQPRTLFRHFDDMAQLHAAIEARVRARVLPLLTPPDLELPLLERVRAMIAERGRVFEVAAPYRRSQDVRRHRSSFAQVRHHEAVREQRAHLFVWLPELQEVDPAARAACEMATSFEAWLRLREEQRLGVARAREAMERAVLAILAT